MVKIMTGRTIYENDRVSFIKLKNGHRYGTHISYSQEIYKPETKKKYLSVGLIWFELNVALKGGI